MFAFPIERVTSVVVLDVCGSLTSDFESFYPAGYIYVLYSLQPD